MLKEIVQYPLPINGVVSTEWLEVKSPYSGEAVASVAQADEKAIDLAIANAEETFKNVMCRMPAVDRSRILARTSELIAAAQETLASTIALEGGKPIKDARAEVMRAANTFAIASREALNLNGEQIPMDLTQGNEGRLGLVLREPIGVVAGITPFNFPINLVAHKVAPALAAGNVVVLKPASATPVSSFRLAALLREAGLPDGALMLVPCPGSRADQLVSDGRLAMLTFTGSPAVGWRLRGQVHPGCRVILELGGNAGMVVHHDADLNAAARAACRGGYVNAGQTCISVQRVYVHEDVYEKFLKVFAGMVKALRVGDPLDEETDVGPLIDSHACNQTLDWIKQAVGQGARVLIGGSAGARNLFMPTVLTNTTPEMLVVCKEVFAPVVSVMPYATIDDAISAMNDGRYGLQAGVFTSNLEVAFKAARQIDVGGVMINEAPTFRADHQPYGGRKESGLGLEGVRYAIQEMTQPKFISLNLPVL